MSTRWPPRFAEKWLTNSQCGGTPDSDGAQAGGAGGGQNVNCCHPPSLRPSPSVLARCMLVYWLRAAAVAVCFEKNTALSRGWCWCTPLARGSAVCECEQNASHNTQILACFSHQLGRVPFLKTQSSAIKRNFICIWPVERRTNELENIVILFCCCITAFLCESTNLFFGFRST